MAANTGKFSRHESGDRIPLIVGSDAWAADIVSLAGEMLGGGRVSDRGFTVQEFAATANLGRARAAEIIAAMVKAGKVRMIGYRPHPSKARVYERT